MNKEIERKFLVKIAVLTPLLDLGVPSAITQAYLTNKIDYTVRVRTSTRIKDCYAPAASKGFLTIKGRNQGIVRPEYEYEIPYQEALDIIQMSNVTIQKDRYRVHTMQHVWEVDFFHGLNEGLVIAEIELQAKDEHVELPSWIDKEVSDKACYYNSNLIKSPYCQW